MAAIQARLTPSHLLPRIKNEQFEKLESNFRENRNPSELDVIIIAAEVGLSEEEVKVWFRHRLACWRQQQGLPANERSVND